MKIDLVHNVVDIVDVIDDSDNDTPNYVPKVSDDYSDLHPKLIELINRKKLIVFSNSLDDVDDNQGWSAGKDTIAYSKNFSSESIRILCILHEIGHCSTTQSKRRFASYDKSIDKLSWEYCGIYTEILAWKWALRINTLYNLVDLTSTEYEYITNCISSYLHCTNDYNVKIKFEDVKRFFNFEFSFLEKCNL